MDIVTKIWISLMFFVTCHTKDFKDGMYMQGENATICIDQLKSTGKRVLEITFSSYTSKPHAILVMLYDIVEKQADYNRKYTGRIKHITMNNASFSFILQNVNFVDSGKYTVFEDSRALGKASIIVPRRLLLGDSNGLMIVPFMYNTANISAIKIDKITSTINILVVMYDVTKGTCKEFGRQYIHRIQNCVFSGKNFSFTIREVSWLDKGMYAAWDATGILLDSMFVDIQENDERSSTEHAHGYFNSSSITNPASFGAENEVWARLLFAAVGAAVTVPLTIAITLLIIRRRGSFQFTCMGPGKRPKEAEAICSDQDIKMEQISKHTIKSADADEGQYEEPHSNKLELRIYLEPIGIETANTENDNPGGSCSRVYEKLHPYGNQGNNTYSSLGAEHIPEVSKGPII